MSYLDPLLHLATLEQGWLNGEGETLDKYHLEILAQKFRTYYNILSLPYFHPTVEGGVWVEWELAYDWGISLEIDLYSLQANYVAVNLNFALKKSLNVNLLLDLNLEEDWDILNSELRKIRNN